jgi:MFS family permease
MLIASRGLQGFGAALVSPATLAIVNTTFPGGDDQRRALSVFAALSAGGAAVGLLLGGILTQGLSWQWIFFVNVPIGVIAIVMALRFVPASHADARRTACADVRGGGDHHGRPRAVDLHDRQDVRPTGWGSTSTLDASGWSLLALIASVHGDRKSCVRSPLVRLSIFRRPGPRCRRCGQLLHRRGAVCQLLFRHALPSGDPPLRPDRDRLSLPASGSC